MSDGNMIQQTDGGMEQQFTDDAFGYLQMLAADYQAAPDQGSPAPSMPGMPLPDDGPGGPILEPDEVVTDRRRPTDEDLPPALLEQVKRARDVYPSSALDLLKYRRTLNDRVVLEFDDGTALPPPEQLAVVSVTTSVVTHGFNEVEVHLLIAAWPAGGPTGDPTM